MKIFRTLKYTKIGLNFYYKFLYELTTCRIDALPIYLKNCITALEKTNCIRNNEYSIPCNILTTRHWLASFKIDPEIVFVENIFYL